MSQRNTKSSKEEKKTLQEIEFFKSLGALASLCKFNLTAEVVEIYDLALCKMGYDRVNRAIMKAIVTRKANDQFPSISDLIDLTDETVVISYTAEANEVANKVWLAIARFGWNNKKPAMEWVGEIGMQVIDQMGWEYLTSLDISQGGTVKAQIRESVKAILERRKANAVNNILSPVEDPLEISSQTHNIDVKSLLKDL